MKRKGTGRGKALAGVLACCMAAGLMVTPAGQGVVQAAEVQAEGNEAVTENSIKPSDFGYNVLDNGTVEITKYYGTDTVIEIPSEINGKQVTSIGERAFSSCNNLTSVIVPENVTSIGKQAFSFCEKLTNVTIPEGVTSIGQMAFYNCRSLTKITIPKGVTSIESRTFSLCSSLKSVTIPESVTKMGDSAFSNCSSLTDIIIPDGVTDIGGGCFYRCSSLNSIHISPKNPSYIAEEGMIYSKDKKVLVSYPESKVENGMIVIPEGVEDFYEGSLCSSDDKTGIVIPVSVKSIKTLYLSTGAWDGATWIGNIYYVGSEEQWKLVEGSDKTDVPVHFNYGSDTPDTPATPAVSPEVQTGENAPATKLSMSQSALADAVLTAEEKQLLADGAEVKIALSVADAGKTVSQADKSATVAALGGYTLGQYLDITLSKTINGTTSGVSETTGKLAITIDVPTALKNTDNTKNRDFAVIRIHDGKAEVLKDTDNSADTITIETDRFSTYAVVYQDKAKSDGAKDEKSPQTGDTGMSGEFYVVWVLLLAVGALMVYTTGSYIRKRR